MSRHLKAVLIILVLGLILIIAAKLAMPVFRDTQQRETSDAAATKGTLVLGMDNWIGYFPLCAKAMATRMRQAGYVLRCENDEADYRTRFGRLKSGEIQFAAATVDAYLLSGAALNFPGTIIAVIDESKGGDALVARREAAANLDQLKKAGGIRIAFTPASPSEHLLRALGVHFDIPFIRGGNGRWRVETNGSSDALSRLIAGEVEAAVLWEPDVSRALAQSAMVQIISTDDTEGLIVDVLLVGRRFSREQPEAVAALLEAYFEVEKGFRERPAALVREVVAATDLTEPQVQTMLRGVSWTTLVENGALWLDEGRAGDPGDERLVEAIQDAVRILMESGAIATNPLPDKDPYRITNRRFIADLYRSAGSGSALAQQLDFAPLDDTGWAQLKEVGTLEMRPIVFRSGTADLTYEGKLELDRMAERLKHYPRFRLLVKGHTGLRGDPQANLLLSQERAAAVARYLLVTYDQDPDRVRSLGYGSQRPLSRKPGESERAYAYRLPRVELALAAENL